MNTNINTPKLSLYHPNCRGTGAALHLELHPASGVTNTEGAVFGCLVRQNTIGDGKTNLPQFDYENRLTFKLDFLDVCKFLQVFRGECETIDDGKGLYHRLPDGADIIRLRHCIDPVCGYSLEVTEKANGTDAENHAQIFLSPAEALGLCEVFAASLKEIAFGTGFEATSIAVAQGSTSEEK